MNMILHAHTPTLAVTDPRGLAVRSVAFCRREQDHPADERVTRHTHDAAGRLIGQRDPRLAHSNLDTIHSLSRQALLTDSVDAGWRLELLGEAGQLIAGWDGRGNQRQMEYDTLLRPLTITEQGLVSERLTYGGPDAFVHNQCNQLVRHDDTAGSLFWADYGVPGSALSEVRRFLQTVETPDWPLPEAERDALLETHPLETRWAFNAVGEVILQTDAMGHAQHFSQTVAGQLKSLELTLAGAVQPLVLVDEIRYNAFDQVEQETAGNGVISRSLYDPQDGRLMERSAGPLQHLKYAYDPVGNILQIEDTAQPVRFFANQQVEPISHYRYDTLYQLIEATGREVSAGASHGPQLPPLQTLPPDPNQVSHYTQSYDYDAAGNLLQMRHVGAQAFTRTMRVAPDRNRSLPEGEVDVDFPGAFDANGNLLHLIRGQTLDWDVRNQLQRITTVTRTTEASDQEQYVYDGQGQRCRKINSTQTASRTLINEARYLPALEIRTTAEGEVLNVINAGNVRVLHWLAGKPDGIANDQVRYSLTDHLGSSTLELDQQGHLISQESYYPFGGTSWWAARSAVEASYKTIRYSGKERDASGLYDYGFRYYAPCLQRWINPDPAGDINGLNFFGFVANSPITRADVDGRVYEGIGDATEAFIMNEGDTILYRGLSKFPNNQKENLKGALAKVRKIYKSALDVISHHPDESVDIMRSFFGPQHAEVTRHIVSSWQQTHLRASEYKGALKDKKFVGIKASDSKEAAYIHTSDPHGRVILNIHQMSKKQLTLTLGHELSHLKQASGSTVTGPGSHDYYYLFTRDLPKLTQESNTLPQNKYQAVAEAITRGGLTPEYFSGFEELERGFKRRVSALHPTPGQTLTIETAIAEFNRHPDIIARMSSRNADSLIFAAHALHRLYTSKSKAHASK
ncbi:RHS repeat domain-containing protein [Pseudomonas sp. NPDC089734]|uniref:RHS repeat domain-containing protein n=1 Tax=Pseudomonas sp. NPDC089734 TaxID=3364469 RepID=UPI0037FD9783